MSNLFLPMPSPSLPGISSWSHSGDWRIDMLIKIGSLFLHAEGSMADRNKDPTFVLSVWLWMSYRHCSEKKHAFPYLSSWSPLNRPVWADEPFETKSLKVFILGGSTTVPRRALELFSLNISFTPPCVIWPLPYMISFHFIFQFFFYLSTSTTWDFFFLGRKVLTELQKNKDHPSDTYHLKHPSKFLSNLSKMDEWIRKSV